MFRRSWVCFGIMAILTASPSPMKRLQLSVGKLSILNGKQVTSEDLGTSCNHSTSLWTNLVWPALGEEVGLDC